jgi:hypothetical protein
MHLVKLTLVHANHDDSIPGLMFQLLRVYIVEYTKFQKKNKKNPFKGVV